MTGLTSKRAGRWAIWFLFLCCAALTALDFTLQKHGAFALEDGRIFYGWFGLVGSIALVIVARIIAPLLRRREDCYAPHATASEEHPESDLSQEKADA
jgi:hypothetical protein